MKKIYLILGTVFIVCIALFFFRHDIPLFDFLFKTERDASGEISMRVMPQFEKGIDFKISMSTKGGELSADMMRSAVFEDEDGTVHLPTSWEGDAPGGKKREGVLHFGELTPMPKKIDLTILNIGMIPQRKFSWMMPSK